MIKRLLENYKPKNEQETFDKKMMLQFIESNHNYLIRDNLTAHFTSSGIILNESMTKILLIHHNIYKSWGWTGGHNDGDEDCLKVAVKEAQEETGVQNFTVYEEPLGIDTVYVPNHVKHGSFVGDHLHMNISYLLTASEEEQLTVKEDENSGVQWFDLNDYLNHVEEPRMIPIYKKLVQEALQRKK
jgi:8-oxo-dGTP pyrophosphatase MutT (NUDIX family)